MHSSKFVVGAHVCNISIFFRYSSFLLLATLLQNCISIKINKHTCVKSKLFKVFRPNLSVNKILYYFRKYPVLIIYDIYRKPFIDEVVHWCLPWLDHDTNSPLVRTIDNHIVAVVIYNFVTNITNVLFPDECVSACIDLVVIIYW